MSDIAGEVGWVFPPFVKLNGTAISIEAIAAIQSMGGGASSVHLIGGDRLLVSLTVEDVLAAIDEALARQ